MAFIVSRNYLDRASEYKWLIRREDQPISQARACRRVVCEKIEFKMSSEDETGFGCNVVARCENAIGIGFEGDSDVKGLVFDYDRFLYFDEEEDGWTCADYVGCLELTPENNVLAINPH